MAEYRCTGYLHLEGTGETANYDFDAEFDSDPTEMDVLHAMMDLGVIQIFHKEAEFLDDVSDDE